MKYDRETEPENYAASDRLLDEALDQAVREEAPTEPKWTTNSEPKPVRQRLTSTLELPSGLSIEIIQSDEGYRVSTYTSMGMGNMSMDEARIAALPAIFIKLSIALAELDQILPPVTLTRHDGQTRPAAVKIHQPSIMASLAGDE